MDPVVQSTSSKKWIDPLGRSTSSKLRHHSSNELLFSSRQRNGKDNGSVLPQAMSENAHIFQEYTYKKITPCDVCSQILRGEGFLVVLTIEIVLCT